MRSIDYSVKQRGTAVQLCGFFHGAGQVSSLHILHMSAGLIFALRVY